MPASGDQHRPNGAVTTNPFEEVKPHISEYTAQEIATLQVRLNKRLGPEFISTRAGPGGAKIAYLPAEKAINLANEVFGFNGWSSSIQGIQIDFVDENPQKGTISIGLSVTVRVTLKDGTYHEDTGYGGIENCKSKISAFEKAKKEGTTDALKRALRNFGNVLGNCIYDKDYITKIAKVKAGQARWDVNELHRHTDFQEKREELISNVPTSIPPTNGPSLIAEDSFDVNEFDEADFEGISSTDGVTIPPDTDRSKAQQYPRPPAQHEMTPSKPPQQRPPGSDGTNPTLNGAIRPLQAPANVGHQERQMAQAKNSNTTNAVSGPPSRSSSPGIPSQHFAKPTSALLTNNNEVRNCGFYSARAAEHLDGNNMPTVNAPVPKFNPHAESPSIPKTTGVDHTKSLALAKGTLQHEPLLPVSKLESPKPNGIARPGPSPMLGNGIRTTSAYRPPVRHSPSSNAGPTATASNIAAGVKRPPLSDLSNVQSGGVTNEEAKRPRIGPGLPGGPVVGDAENMPR